jgi:AcrR family transcriptional regulator
MTRRSGSSGAKTLKAIRGAGLRLIFEHGFEAMSLRQLASEVGIQAGSLYNHIATKQQLLVDLIREHMEDLISSLDARLEGVDDPVERLRTFVSYHVTTHMWRKQEVYISTFELRALEPANYARIIRLRRLYEERLNAILDLGVARGVFDLADTRVATFALLAMLTGVCTWYRPNGRLSKEAIVELHTNLALRGVTGKPARAPARRATRTAVRAPSARRARQPAAV